LIPYPHIDPVIFAAGPLKIRWYGLMYVLGFIASYMLVKHQIKQLKLHDFDRHFENLNMTLILCLVLGGRLGYVLFYNFSYYIKYPLEILATWHGGMSFHGAFIGVIIGAIFFCRAKKLDFWQCADLFAVTTPIGIGLGRIGNFINGELFGRATTVPWAMVFPDGGPVGRHPSQLYESLLEGVVLFIILWTMRNRLRFRGAMLALFLLFYGFFRMVVELFREPDVNIGLLAGLFTMGQLLSSFMILAGAAIFFFRRPAKEKIQPT